VNPFSKSKLQEKPKKSTFGSFISNNKSKIQHHLVAKKAQIEQNKI
jgi:hypothetical protein